MDPVESFIKANRKFSLHLLINAHSRLSVIQLSKGTVSYEDILQSLCLSGQELPNADLTAHAAVIYEGVLSPTINAKNQVALQMNRDIIANDNNFIKSILNVMYSRCGNTDYPNVEEFKLEAYMFLKGGNSFTSQQFGGGRPSADMVEQNVPRNDFAYRPSFNANKPRFSQESMLLKKPPTSNNIRGMMQDVMEPPIMEDHRSAVNRIEFEKSEPIVRLLAQVRKVGMDILFPQSTHDKILACIFVAIRSAATPAHRELIDMVMAVKESNSVSQLESVSKTKVRGVLALLKHGELLVTQGSEGEPVRLFLAYGINSFKDLRERHDSFLNRYMMEHHIFIPAILKSELVWQVDDEMKSQRIDAMNKLVTQLQLFFKGFQGFVKPSMDYEEPTAAFSSSTLGKSNFSSGNMYDFSPSVGSGGMEISPPESVFQLKSAAGGRSVEDSRFDLSPFNSNNNQGALDMPDQNSPDWVNLGRKTANMMRKANQQQPPQSMYNTPSPYNQGPSSMYGGGGRGGYGGGGGAYYSQLQRNTLSAQAATFRPAYLQEQRFHQQQHQHGHYNNSRQPFYGGGDHYRQQVNVPAARYANATPADLWQQHQSYMEDFGVTPTKTNDAGNNSNGNSRKSFPLDDDVSAFKTDSLMQSLPAMNLTEGLDMFSSSNTSDLNGFVSQNTFNPSISSLSQSSSSGAPYRFSDSSGAISFIDDEGSTSRVSMISRYSSEYHDPTSRGNSDIDALIGYEDEFRPSMMEAPKGDLVDEIVSSRGPSWSQQFPPGLNSGSSGSSGQLSKKSAADLQYNSDVNTGTVPHGGEEVHLSRSEC